MTDTALADQAGRRARLAALLGRLLVAEPGADAAGLVTGVPALAPLGTDDRALAADYERLLLREVPPYESVFLGDDGQRGGPVVAEVVAAYERHGFDEAGRWRVAGPDHLGLELRCYALLCAEEEAGWRDEQPDRAARAVEAQRGFLAAHLGRWGRVAASAVLRRAGTSPYAALAAAVDDYLAAEDDLLRPDPDHPDLAPVAADPPPDRLGPARLARFLLAPGRSGVYLDADDLAEAALGLGIPWRPSDPRSRLRAVLEDAADAGDLPDLVARLRPAVAWWAADHARREAASDGARRTWRAWRHHAEATLDLLDRLAVPAAGPAAGPAVVAVTGADRAETAAAAAGAVASLRAAGLSVAVVADLRDRLRGFLAPLLDAGADSVLVEGADVAVTAVRDAGPGRWTRHLDGAAVVVALREDPRARPPTVSLVSPGADPEVAGRIGSALGATP